MATTTDTETTLIRKLETSDYTLIHHHISTYLHPFTTLTTTAPKSKSTSKSSKPSQTLIHSLAKKYLPFLNRLLSLLPKSLSTLNPPDPSSIRELFAAYRFCLGCLDSISSQLSGKPYSVAIQRLRMVHCYVACGLYKEAEDEGVLILEGLKGSESSSSKLGKSKGRYVPDLGKECTVDGELALVVVEIVVTLVKCAAMNGSEDGAVYTRVLTLLTEVRPWFGVLDANVHDKSQKNLVTYLNKCTLFLVEDLMRFETDLIWRFCSATLNECTKLTTKEPLFKVSRRICSLVLSQDYKRSPVISDILKYVIASTAAQCKIEAQNNVNDFLEIVSYCANKCRTSGTRLYVSVATHLNQIAGDFHEVYLAPLELILRIYAIGLSFTNCNIHRDDGGSSTMKNSNDIFEIRYLLDHEEKLQSLAILLGLLRGIFPISGIEKNVSLFVGNGDSADSTCSKADFDFKKILVCKKNKMGHSLFYLNALKFTCQPLAEFVNLAKKHILVEDEDTPHFDIFCVLEEVFLLLGDVFLFCKSFTNEIERNGLDGSDRLVFSGAVAAYTLSFRTKVNVKSSVQFIKHVISNGSFQLEELKYIFISLYNMGVILYRHNLVKGASEALQLSCRASWACVSLLCQTFVEKSKGLSEEMSEAAIVDFVKDASLKCVFFVEVLCQCACHKEVRSIIVDTLQKWTNAGTILKSLPSPISLLNQWVKIECKASRNEDEKYVPMTTYSVLSSSDDLLKSTASTLLEQELQAYEEMTPKFPKFCKRMQLEIMGILLEDIYTTKDSCLQKTKILIKKGTLLRADGFKFPKDCIQCFTEAILTIEDSHEGDILACHYLAVAHCLRALFKQEADPNAKENFQDIRAALNAWLSMNIPDQCEVSDQGMMVSDMTFPLLYRIIDLLSLKGSIEFHHDIYKLMIRLFKWKNLPLEKCLAMLWKYRRLSHALCASPVNDVFIATLSEHCGDLSKSMDYWIGCLQMSRPLVLGFKLNFSFLFTINNQCSSHKSSSQPQITIDEVKHMASELISSVNVPNHSPFLAGHLFYDLCEGLLSNGRPIEALSCAKEAHQLRGKLFQDYFSYSIDKRKEDFCNSSELSNNQKNCLTNFQILSSVATGGWSEDSVTGDMERYNLTPWNVLQCYLESTLQVGSIHEMVGNCTEAEILLRWGKSISIAQGLPFFVVSFSSILGKLYRKKRQWDMGAIELQNAEKIMTDNPTGMSCLKCRLILEVTINQQRGDLLRNQYDNCASSNRKLCDVEKMYRTALEKLDQSEWKICISAPRETTAHNTMNGNCFDKVVEHDNCNVLAACSTGKHGFSDYICTGDLHDQAKFVAERSRKPKKASKQLPHETILVTEHNLRVTRSRSRSCQNKNISHMGNVQVEIDESSNHNNGPACVDGLSNRMSLLKVQSSAVGVGYEVKCTCKQMNYWQCFLAESMASGLPNDFLHLKWEFMRRRLSLRLLTGIGKCCGVRGEFHATHEAFLRSATILCCRNPFSNTHSSVSISSFLDVIGKEISGDVFALERASVLYNFCWYSLKNYHSKETRTCCDISVIQIPKLFSWLLLAFVLCRQAPFLFQKVCKLLAAVCLYFASSKSLSFPLSACKTLSPSHYASFFHQASIGTHLNNQMLSIAGKQHSAHCLFDAERSPSTCSHCNGRKTYNLLRLAPEKLHEIDEFVANFFESLPRVAVVCLSLFGGGFASLLNDLLLHPSSVCSWILLSRLNSKSQPFVILLPVNSILEGSDDDSSNSDSGHVLENSYLSQWHCPWGSTVVDDVAPGFRLILKESYLSSSICSQEDTKRTRSLWWARRKKLDQCLGKLLRDVEDLWLGACKYLLMGEWMDSRRLSSTEKKLALNLINKCNLNVNESILRVILRSASYADDKEECVQQLCLYNGCYIGSRSGYDDKERAPASSHAHRGVECLSKTALKLLVEAVNELEQDEFLERQPIILVPDSEIQMLPWENLPILRNQEVYRMPSVGCITTALAKGCQCEEQSTSNTATFPFIDPLDAFYLLNPSGDLSGTQIEFENWFKDQKLEGIAGKAPTIEDMSTALTGHDLFIYFGHGSGVQYIPGHEIQKLDSCAATLLMGCSSGSLSLSGCYPPQGIPISYLLAGSPIIVSNLWEVTDKDIDRFGKAMLEAWMRERSNPFSGVDHRPRIGSFISEARKACILPFLNGAAPICYGIPTGIRKKKDL